MRLKENYDIEFEIFESGFKRYEIAHVIGIDESNFSRWFQKPLSDERKKKVRDAIKTLKKRK